jgi:phage gp46-like protein
VPDNLMTIELTLKAPEAEGAYWGDCQIQNDLGAKLYEVWVEIEVGVTL